MLRSGAPPPAFPPDLIVPRHRGAVICDAQIHDAVPAGDVLIADAPNLAAPAAIPLVRAVPVKRRKKQGNKARKAAMRKAARIAAVRVPVPASVTVLVVAPPTLSPPAAPPVGDGATVPLPRARALVPARRQGLVDVIAFLLRDSGRRLARWSARREKSRAERDQLARANTRHRMLQLQRDALDALQERGKPA